MKITFIGADTLRTYIAAIHENEQVPYKRRSVTIELTNEQLAQLEIRTLGHANGTDWKEEIISCFVENEE